MSLIQSNKVGVLKVTKPTSPTLAGEIRSTSEDTSGWSTDASGNKIDNGRLALSTSASTTITACETLYPDLWAKAPTGWRSGSNLIVPAQAGFVSEVASGTITTPDTGYTIDTAVDDWVAIREGNQVTIWFALKFNWSSPADSSPDLTFGLPASMVPAKEQTFTISRNDGSWDESVLLLNSGGNFVLYRNVGFSGFTASGTFYTGHASWDYGVSITYQVSGVASNGDTTPYIQAYNNIAAGALGLPAATATQAGTVSAEASGSYAPGAYSITNCSGSSVNSARYQVIGNQVTVWASVTTTVASSNTYTELDISTPLSLSVLSNSSAFIQGNASRTSNRTNIGVATLGSSATRMRMGITPTTSGSLTFEVMWQFIKA